MKKSTDTLYCLHGFLGRPADWDAALARSGLDWRSLDLIGLGAMNAKLTFDAIAERVNDVARESSVGRRVLVGYSMGGRIALQALVHEPALWDAAIIVSANPGLPVAEEARARAELDRAWALRVRFDPWDKLVHAWQSQPVFHGRKPAIPRLEREFDRSALAWAMEQWSLGRQRDLRPELAKLRIPVLFVSGEHDAKYLSIARQCAALNPEFELAALAGAAHRVPWEAPELFLEALSDFLERQAAKKAKEKTHVSPGQRTLDQDHRL
jgi:2-succinyl-6-hydroxy-2,4-cyclohexadiene-1-carboxylate synthase